ncbi:MAG: hypothetical protein IIB57_15720, partial [Planctomycetes bacterium]|nr:hypothetical protein [Planctomycetota bacterium]
MSEKKADGLRQATGHKTMGRRIRSGCRRHSGEVHGINAKRIITMSFLLVAAFLAISVSTVRTMVSPLGLINAAPPAHAADVRSIRAGATTIWGHRPHMKQVGVQLTTIAETAPANSQQVEALLIDSLSGVTVRIENGRVVAIIGAIRHRGVLRIETPAGSFDLENPILTFDPTLTTARLVNGARVPADTPSLVLDDLSVQYRIVDNQVIISTDNVRLSAAWAHANGVVSAASLSIAGVLITLDAGQGMAKPAEAFEPSRTSDTSGSTGRGAIGPDIIVMKIPNILSYGSTMTCSESGHPCSIDESSGISDCRTCSVRGCACQTDADCKTCTVSGEPCFDDLECGGTETCDVVESCIPSGDSCNVPVSAFSIATRSCNIGDEDADWNASTNAHPVISQNMFRLKDGRFEQIGMAWVKHGFASINLDDSCGDCQLPQNPSSQFLYVGCSDPYSTSLNGEQANMGPRSQIDAHTGVFPFPYTRPCEDLDPVIARRLQVHDADLDTAQNDGALYFVEAQYVAADEAQAGNGDNTVSYRRIFVQSLMAAMSPTMLTQQQKAGIRAWADTDPDVIEVEIRVPGEGLLVLASKTTELGNGAWRYEYALQNVNSARSIQSFSLPLPDAAEITEMGFHDVDYHSGEPFDGTDWVAQVTPDAIAWATDTYAENANANALRWGTLYNFRFTTNAEPAMTTLTLGLFRPGSPQTFTVTVPGPALDLIDCNDNLIADSCDVDCQAEGCDPP